MFSATVGAVRDDRVSFDLDFDFRALFQLNLLSVFIREPVWHSDLTVQVICAFYSYLRLFRFSRPGMRMDDFLDFPWKRCACF